MPGTLSFAPFASKGYHDSSGISFSSLPASKDEIAKLKGIIFYRFSQLQKIIFCNPLINMALFILPHMPSVNNLEPSRSFIAFYPGNNDYRTVCSGNF